MSQQQVQDAESQRLRSPPQGFGCEAVRRSPPSGQCFGWEAPQRSPRAGQCFGWEAAQRSPPPGHCFGWETVQLSPPPHQSPSSHPSPPPQQSPATPEPMELGTDEIPIIEEVTLPFSGDKVLTVPTTRPPRIRTCLKNCFTPEPTIIQQSSAIPFMVFDGKEIQIITSDGRKFMARKKLVLERMIYQVTLFQNEFDDEKQKPAKQKSAKIEKLNTKTPEKSKNSKSKSPALITIESDPESESDIEVLEIVTPNNAFRQFSKPSPVIPTKNEKYQKASKGKVEVKRTTQKFRGSSFTDKLTRNAQVFRIDNLSYAEEQEFNWFIDHLDSTVMNKDNQLLAWEAASKFQVPRSDLPISQLFNVHIVKPEEFIDICCILRRAFFTFLRRAWIMYSFLYPQVTQESLPEVLVQLWLCLTLEEREVFYYRNHKYFDTEMLNILIRFPPGIVEAKILEALYPNGEKNPRSMTYNDIFRSYLEVKIEAEQRRQAEDMDLLTQSTETQTFLTSSPPFEFELPETKVPTLFQLLDMPTPYDSP